MVLNYFNASSADFDGRLVERRNPQTRLIELATRATDSSHPKLTIFGNDNDTKNGTCVPDYVYVIDFCAAHLMAINHLNFASAGKQFNYW